MKFLFFSVLFFHSTLIWSAPSQTFRLSPLNLDSSQTTISGVSAGAFMATQMAIANSRLFAGVASVAGGIYWCSEGDLNAALGTCMKTPQDLRVDRYLKKVMSEERLKNIDPIQFVLRQKLFLYASPKDTILNPIATVKLQQFYSKLIPVQNMTLRTQINSDHGFPTLSFGANCTKGDIPWLLKCNYDLAGDILKTMYGPLRPKKATKRSSLFAFDQQEFRSSDSLMANEGLIYVPEPCRAGQKCRLHVALHGCKMSPEFAGYTFATNSGYNEWAETNNIVVLYPYVRMSFFNPNACFDWWGYTTSDFANKKGPQIQSLEFMIQRLLKTGPQ
jgi:hypothetical protein